MSDYRELLSLAILELDIATLALASARRSLLAVAVAVGLVELSRPPGEGDGWPTNAAEFGLAVRRARQAARLTREGLAERIGVALTTIQNVERARHRCTPKIRALLIATLIKVPS